MPARQAPTGRSCLSRADGGRREEMTSPEKWKLYGNPMKIQWKPWKSYENQWKPNGNPMEIHEHLKSAGWKFYGNLRKSYENRWRSYGFCGNPMGICGQKKVVLMVVPTCWLYSGNCQ